MTNSKSETPTLRSIIEYYRFTDAEIAMVSAKDGAKFGRVMVDMNAMLLRMENKLQALINSEVKKAKEDAYVDAQKLYSETHEELVAEAVRTELEQIQQIAKGGGSPAFLQRHLAERIEELNGDTQ